MFLSHITPLTSLHFAHPDLILPKISPLSEPSAPTTSPRYLNSVTFLITSTPILISSSYIVPLKFSTIYSVFFLLIFSPFSSSLFTHLPRSSSTSIFSLSANIMSSANSIFHGASFCKSLVSVSSTIMNKKGLRADPCFTPTLTLKLSVRPQVLLTCTLSLSYMSCTSLIYFSGTPLSLKHCHIRSLVPYRQQLYYHICGYF